MQTYPKTTDANRATIGITVLDTSKMPSPTPTTRPLVSVDPSTRLTHHLRLIDESSPTRRGKREDVAGAEVWVKLVDAGQPAPTDPAALSFLTLTSRPTVRTEFRVHEGGKTAVYMLRWVNTRGEKGPWSEVAAASGSAWGGKATDRRGFDGGTFSDGACADRYPFIPPRTRRGSR